MCRGASRRAYALRAIRPVGGGYLIRLAGIADRETAATLTLSEVRVRRAVLPPLEPGEFYVEDVPGCVVEDETGRARGLARNTFWNGAHDVLTVDVDGEPERLVPLVPEFVLGVDGPGRKIRLRWDRWADDV